MPLDLLPDAEALVSAFLRDQAELAALVDDRVYTVIPRLDKGEAEWRFPLVRVSRYGGAPAFAQPLWIDQPTMQVDAFGGPKATAHDIASTCQALLDLRLIGRHDLGVVSDVVFGSKSYVPDPGFDPARPRYLFTFTATMHPNPAS